jgi:hypothetical protein
MSHYAQLNENDIVTRVLVIEQDVIDTGLFGDPNLFVQTSYNTLAGEHLLGDTPLRKNFAGIGYTYDRSRDAFIPPKPFSSWSLNEDTCQWNAPVPQPVDTNSVWNEETMSWIIT